MSNEDKFNEYKKRKLLRYLMMFLSLVTITLEAFALFQMISFLWGLATFAILYVVKYFYFGKVAKEDSSKDKKTDKKVSKKVKKKKDSQK